MFYLSKQLIDLYLVLLVFDVEVVVYFFLLDFCVVGVSVF